MGHGGQIISDKRDHWPIGVGAAEERNLPVRAARRQQPCDRLTEGLGPLPLADPRCRPFEDS